VPGPLLALRGALSVLLVMLWFVVPGFPLMYLALLPAALLQPGRRRALVSAYMKFMTGGILALLRAGGARFERTGTLPTATPVVVLANHQSLIDILTVTLLGRPYVPAFVTRRRYARFVPLVSPCIRLLRCPIVDPRRDARGAVETMRQAARTQEHGLLVFPEGHRSRDGEIRAFRPAGTEAVLEERRVPVYLVVSDGLWVSRRFVDFALNVHKIRGKAEVIGPFEPPAAPAEIPAFVERMRDTMVSRLRQMRERRDAGV
jgi:1-acyl-sn-glycerol-3-phosphate acyltransferase